MKKCWAKVPSDRPTFHELVFELSRLLEDGIEYLQLDIPSVSNPGYDIFNQNEPPTTNTASVTSGGCNRLGHLLRVGTLDKVIS